MAKDSNRPFAEFSPIGLALSGGGTRAAAFHLGCLSYLEEVGLLSHLKMLSTVSGGTFTGAKFVVSLVNRQEFNDYFKEFYILLRDTEFLKEGLRYLIKKRGNVPSGRQNAIVSAAQVYAETLLKTPGGTVLFGEILNSNISVEEVIFNAIDFHSGNDFRFQKSISPDAKIGNFYSWIPKAAADQIRVADIVAASSCIPPGFEPMVFPDDFVWPNNTIPPDALCARNNEPVPVPLMDGGIYDNTGIESLLLADRRHSNQVSSLGLVIMSDVSQPSEKIHEYPERIHVMPLTLGLINAIIWTGYFVLFVSAVVLGHKLFGIFQKNEFKFFWDFSLYVTPFVFIFFVVGVLWWGRGKTKAILRKVVPHVGTTFWGQLKRLTLTKLVNMGNRRYQSMIDLVASVFMMRIRQQTRNAIYADKKYIKKRLANYIYHLETGRRFSPKLANLGVKEPTPDLQKVIDDAVDMPTVMWFDYPHELPCLVASGQATVCYNLMKHAVRLYGKNVTTTPEWNTLVKDWNRLRHDPYVLLKKLLPDTDLPWPP